MKTKDSQCLTTTIGVRVTDAQRRLIERLATADRRHVGAFVRNILEDHIPGLKEATA